MSTLKRAGNALTSQDQIDIRRDIGLPLPTSGDAASGQVVTGGDSRLTDARTPSGTAIAAATSKTTPVDADNLALSDSADSNNLKRLTWANVKATLKTYFDGLYVSLTGIKTINGQTLIGSGDLTVGGGSGAITGSGLTMATARLLGRSTAGTGAPEEITLGTNLSFSGTTLNAAGGGATWTSIAYATAIPLDGQKWMPDTSLAAATTFTISGTPIAGTQCKLGLIATGTTGHVPTFSGMTLDPAGDVYNNTANRLNNVFVWHDGVRVWVTLRDTGLTIAAAATALTLTGPSSGTNGTASSNFTVTANGALSGSVTVTPNDSSDGGAFTPSTLTLNSGTLSGTFTYTPASTGAKTIGITNSGGLTNPSALTYTSNSSTTVPGAPTGATATAGNAQATVTFTAPASNGGATITGYTATSSPGGFTGTVSGASAAPITVTGLTNGTAYTFTVTATNSVGTGPASSASNSVTPAAGITWGTWSSLQNATTTPPDLISNGSSPGGGLINTVIDGTGAVSVTAYFATQAAANGVVICLSKNNTADYVWHPTNYGSANSQALFFFVSTSFYSGKNYTESGVTATAQTFPCYVRVRKSGADAIFERSTDLTSWTSIGTSTGAFTGASNLYVKSVFAAANAANTVRAAIT